MSGSPDRAMEPDDGSAVEEQRTMETIERRTVTCVIPTHLRSSLLGEALDSVRAQTAPPLEILVVSDVDDPAAERACDERTSAELPIRFLRNRVARGASASRNLGAAEARGGLIALLDDDDLWEPTYLESATGVLAARGTDAVVTWIKLFTATSEAPGPQIDEALLPSDVAVKNPGATGSNIIVSSAAFNRVGGFDEALPVKNDTDFLLRFLLEGRTYAVAREPLVKQRKHQQGQLTAKSEMRAQGVEAYLRKHRARLTSSQVRKLQFDIHRMRRHTASRRVGRVRHLIGAVLHYSLQQYRDDRRTRDQQAYWSVTEFEDLQQPRR